MLWCSIPEISFVISLIIVILYGLICLKSSVRLDLGDVYMLSRYVPLNLGISMVLENYDSVSSLPVLRLSGLDLSTQGLDLILIGLTVVVLGSFKTLESIILVLVGYMGQALMLHSIDLLGFYVCLELQNFSFLVLCGLQPKLTDSTIYKPSAIEVSIKYLLLSAFSSGILLYEISIVYLDTGETSLASLGLLSTSDHSGLLVLTSILFKLGVAPLHIWLVEIYSGINGNLLVYVSTGPKLSLIGLWTNTWHTAWSDVTLIFFVVLSMVLGSVGGYSQVTLRSLFAYSGVNEIGLLLMAVETGGFNSLYQHLTIYLVSTVLLWSGSDKRVILLLTVSLAGLPPLAGFFGKAWVFGSVAISTVTGGYLGVLLVSLLTTVLSLIYYLRVVRLFAMIEDPITEELGFTKHVPDCGSVQSSISSNTSRSLTSYCIVFIIFIPLFYLKPFVL
jgi:NADH:ubiquinone oxidoreductase subunit 2 (subunit N)